MKKAIATLVRYRGYSVEGCKLTRISLHFDEDGHLLNPRALAFSSLVGWGHVQMSRKMTCQHGQCWWVSTAGHGGYIVVTDHKLDWAKDPMIDLQVPGLDPVLVYEFEEDCDWALLEHHDSKVLASAAHQIAMFIGDRKQQVAEFIQRYHAPKPVAPKPVEHPEDEEEANFRNCSNCGKLVVHESYDNSPPEAEYIDGDAYCPACACALGAI